MKIIRERGAFRTYSRGYNPVLVPIQPKGVPMARPRKSLPSDLADLAKKTEILEREMSAQRAAIERLKQLGQVRRQPLRAPDAPTSTTARRRAVR